MATFNSIYSTQSREVQSLARSIRRSLGKDQRHDVYTHGADSGWPGFSYTSDCVRFYNRHETAIWELLSDDAENMGESIPQFIAGFRRVDMAYSGDGFKNLLTWYALETICRMEFEAE